MRTIIQLSIVCVVCSGLFANSVLPDGTPDPAYPSFYAWYQADWGVAKIDDTAASDGEVVYKWQNALGNSDRDIYAVGSASIVYNTNVLNGKPSLYFPDPAGLQGTPSSWGEISQPNTFFFVMKHDSIGTDFIMDGAAGDKRNIFLTHEGYWKINGGKQVATAQAFTGEFVVHCIKIDGVNSYHYINGELMAEVDAGTSLMTMGGFSLGIMWSGVGNAIKGSVSEVLVYDGSLSDSDRSGIENYLMSEYSIGNQTGEGVIVSKFDGSDIDVYEGSNFVTSWNDQIGNWDAIGVYDANDTCPTVVTETFPAGDFNIIKFDGNNDYLQTMNGGEPLSQPITLFMVGRKYSLSGSPYWFDGISSSERLIYFTNTVDGELVNRAFGGSYVEGFTTDLNLWQIHTVVYNGFWSSLYLDGFFQGEGAVGGNKLGGLTIGSRFDLTANYLHGDIAEVLIYSGALSDDNRKAVEASLSAKYGLEPSCGAAYTEYLDYDLNKDCVVDIVDFSLLAGQWLGCSDPASCPEFYQSN